MGYQMVSISRKREKERRGNITTYIKHRSRYIMFKRATGKGHLKAILKCHDGRGNLPFPRENKIKIATR